MSQFSYLVGRFSGVHLWPVLGVPRGAAVIGFEFASAFSLEFSVRVPETRLSGYLISSRPQRNRDSAHYRSISEKA